jgi:LytR cell envelope-related transcriptional attenuator
MQTTERPPTGPPRGTSPVRGVVLVAVAVVLGFFILRAIDDSGAGTSIDTESAGDSEVTGGSTPPPASETTLPPPRPPAEVVVLVANASGVQGAAAAQTEAIQAGGYQVLPAGNASAEVETTQVLVVAGFEAEGAVLAADIAAGEGAVQPMPDPPPVDPAGANIVVLLGPDLASG